MLRDRHSLYIKRRDHLNLHFLYTLQSLQTTEVCALHRFQIQDQYFKTEHSYLLVKGVSKSNQMIY